MPAFGHDSSTNARSILDGRSLNQDPRLEKAVLEWCLDNMGPLRAVKARPRAMDGGLLRGTVAFCAESDPILGQRLGLDDPERMLRALRTPSPQLTAIAMPSSKMSRPRSRSGPGNGTSIARQGSFDRGPIRHRYLSARLSHAESGVPESPIVCVRRATGRNHRLAVPTCLPYRSDDEEPVRRRSNSSRTRIPVR